MKRLHLLKKSFIKVSQIAKNLKLSTATVSRALNGSSLVTGATLERVREEAKRLGHEPNVALSQLMSHLRTGKIKEKVETFAFLVTIRPPWGQTQEVVPIFYAYYQGAKAKAAELGYNLEILWRDSPRTKHAKINSLLRARGIQGIMVAPRPRPLGHFRLDWRHFAAVSLAHPLPQRGIHTVSAAYFSSISRTLRFLRKRGFQRIGLATPRNSDQYSGNAYSAGYWSYYHSIASKNRIPVIFLDHQKISIIAEGLLRWYEKYKPEVIISVGMAAHEILTKAGIRIPRDVGYFDLTLPSVDSKVSGIYENIEEISQEAVHLLTGMIQRNQKGIQPVPRHHAIEGTIIEGKTL